MFNSCSGLIGNLPELPEGLQSATRMFRFCSGLSGSAPVMPTSLTAYEAIFDSTQVTNNETTP
ncbi:MAG: hypothetical protein IJV97_02505 [Alphaproteobacteria bacterium]|nr:hypothetical protein [Alphaproteobacteria bacterium]